jgi:hypothetical protein
MQSYCDEMDMTRELAKKRVMMMMMMMIYDDDDTKSC